MRKPQQQALASTVAHSFSAGRFYLKNPLVDLDHMAHYQTFVSHPIPVLSYTMKASFCSI